MKGMVRLRGLTTRLIVLTVSLSSVPWSVAFGQPVFVASGIQFHIGPTGPDIAVFDDGSVVVAWTSEGVTSRGAGVYLQLFDPNGLPTGDVIRANDLTPGGCDEVFRSNPSVAVRSDGSFIVAWHSYNNIPGCPNYGFPVFYRVFGNGGVPQGPVEEVTPAGYYVQPEHTPVVGAWPDGSFVVAWTRQADPFWESDGVYFQIFDGDASPVGPISRASTPALSEDCAAIFASSPALDASPQGTFVVAWHQSWHVPECPAYGADIHYREFTSAGVATGPERLVTAGAYGAPSALGATPAVSYAGDGSLVAAWWGWIGDWNGILSQRISQLGEPLGELARVSHPDCFIVSDRGVGRNVDVASQPDGSYVVVWRAKSSGTSGVCPGEIGVFLRWFHADGTPQGDTVLVSPPFPWQGVAEENDPAVDLLAGAHAVVSWYNCCSAHFERGIYYDVVPAGRPGLAQMALDRRVDEGSLAQLEGVFSDADGDQLFIESDCSGLTDLGSGRWEWSETMIEGPFERWCLVSASDPSENVESDAFLVRVLNVAPVLGEIGAPLDPVPVDSPIAVNVSFSDPGIEDVHTATWHWGDNSSEPGTVSEVSGSGTVTGGHSYSVPGVYTLTAIVDDDDGASSSTEFQYVVAFDPDGGFVTGGGWIESPPGSYVADPALSGRANFGFVSKYEAGASIPTGDTQFRFRVADLTFHSASYEWLVIAGARAKYKGVGTINEFGSYGFMLTAIDGGLPGGQGADKFRIKIWDKDNGDAVVYDNQMGADDQGDPSTVIGGGSIKIHKNQG